MSGDGEDDFALEDVRDDIETKLKSLGDDVLSPIIKNSLSAKEHDEIADLWFKHKNSVTVSQDELKLFDQYVSEVRLEEALEMAEATKRIKAKPETQEKETLDRTKPQSPKPSISMGDALSAGLDAMKGGSQESKEEKEARERAEIEKRQRETREKMGIKEPSKLATGEGGAVEAMLKARTSNQEPSGHMPQEHERASSQAMSAAAEVLKSLHASRASGSAVKPEDIQRMAEGQAATAPTAGTPPPAPPLPPELGGQDLSEGPEKSHEEAQAAAIEEETSELSKPDSLFIKEAQNLLDVFGEFASGDFNREYEENLIITLDNISQYKDLSEISSQIGHGEVPITWKSISNRVQHQLFDSLPEELTEEQRHFIYNYYKADEIFNLFDQEEYSEQLNKEVLSLLKSALENYIENPDANNAKILCEAWDRDQEHVVDISLEDKRSKESAKLESERGLSREDQDIGYDSGLENPREAQAATSQAAAEPTAINVNVQGEAVEPPPPPGPAPDFTSATPASPASSSSDAVEDDGYDTGEEAKNREKPDIPPKPQLTNSNSLSSEERSEASFSTPDQDSAAREESLLATQESSDKKSKAEEERTQSDIAQAYQEAVANVDEVENKKPPIAKKPNMDEIAAKKLALASKSATKAKSKKPDLPLKPKLVRLDGEENKAKETLKEVHLLDEEKERIARREAFKERIKIFEPKEIKAVEKVKKLKIDADKEKKSKLWKPLESPYLEDTASDTISREDTSSSKSSSRFQEDMAGVKRGFDFQDAQENIAKFAAGDISSSSARKPIDIAGGGTVKSIKDRINELKGKPGFPGADTKPPRASGLRFGIGKLPKKEDPTPILDDFKAAAIADALHKNQDFPSVPKKFDPKDANLKTFLQQIENYPEVQSNNIVSKYEQVKINAETMVSNATFVAKSMEPREKAECQSHDEGKDGWRKTYKVDVTREGTLYMPRKTKKGKTVRNAAGDVVFDVLYYDKKGSGFELNLDKSFIAPDDVPEDSYSSVTKDIRDKVLNHHEQRFEKGLGKNKPKDISHSVSDLALESAKKAASAHVATEPEPEGAAPSASDIKKEVKVHAASPASSSSPAKSKEEVAAELIKGKKNYKPGESSKDEIARKAPEIEARRGSSTES